MQLTLISEVPCRVSNSNLPDSLSIYTQAALGKLVMKLVKQERNISN